ncbi:DUF305 domain-containing protein [Arthrobacter monumenti]
MKRIPLTLAAATIVVALAGCGSPSDDMSGMEHGTSGSSSSASSSAMASPHSGHEQSAQDQLDGEQHNAADAMFATMMIPHHEQAVMMSGMILEKESISPEIRELAGQIKAAQGPEIQRMSNWLKAWDEPVPVGGHGMGHDMGGDGKAMEGMLSAEQLEELEAVQGTEAERLFLKQMIEHHKGAIAMAKQEIQQGSNPAAVELAEDIVSAQKAEIGKMQQLLETL